MTFNRIRTKQPCISLNSCIVFHELKNKRKEIKLLPYCPEFKSHYSISRRSQKIKKKKRLYKSLLSISRMKRNVTYASKNMVICKFML